MQNNELIESIEHDGVVVGVESVNDLVHVRTSDKEECSSCAASVLCSGSGKDTIAVRTPHAGDFHTGDLVTISGTEQMHRKAIMLATVLPCIALIAVMVGVYIASGNQLAAVLSGLGATVIFYAVLYLCRYKIAHEFVFTISHRKAPGD